METRKLELASRNQTESNLNALHARRCQGILRQYRGTSLARKPVPSGSTIQGYLVYQKCSLRQGVGTGFDLSSISHSVFLNLQNDVWVQKKQAPYRLTTTQNRASAFSGQENMNVQIFLKTLSWMVISLKTWTWIFYHPPSQLTPFTKFQILQPQSQLGLESIRPSYALRPPLPSSDAHQCCILSPVPDLGLWQGQGPLQDRNSFLQWTRCTQRLSLCPSAFPSYSGYLHCTMLFSFFLCWPDCFGAFSSFLILK